MPGRRQLVKDVASPMSQVLSLSHTIIWFPSFQIKAFPHGGQHGQGVAQQLDSKNCNPIVISWLLQCGFTSAPRSRAHARGCGSCPEFLCGWLSLNGFPSSLQSPACLARRWGPGFGDLSAQFGAEFADPKRHGKAWVLV